MPSKAYLSNQLGAPKLSNSANKTMPAQLALRLLSCNPHSVHSTSSDDMPNSLRACKSVLSNRQKTPPAKTPTSLWISDDVLNDALHRFLHIQKRNGSSIPGPLESRRRASKRKNTHLAYQAGQGAPIEVTNLFGPGKQQLWWNGTRSEEKRSGNVEKDGVYGLRSRAGEVYQAPVASATPTLPAWLQTLGGMVEPAEVLEASERTAWPEALGPAAETMTTKSPISSSYSSQAFTSALSQARNIEDIRVLLRLAPLPDRFRMAFKQLLNGDYSTNDFALLLEDRARLCPQHQCHLQIVRHLGSIPDVRCKRLLSLLEVEIENDRIQKKELNALIRLIPKILFKASGSRLGSEMAQTFLRLLSSIEKSQALSFQDIEESSIKTILSSTMTMCTYGYETPLLARLITLWPKQSYTKSSEIISSWLKVIGKSAQSKTKNLLTAQVAGFLKRLDPEAFARVVVMTSEAILSSAMHDSDQVSEVREWTTVLKGISARGKELLTSSFWLDIPKKGGTALSSTQSAYIRMWAVSHIAASNIRVRTSEKHLSLLSSLLHQYRQSLPSKADLKEMIFLSAQSLPVRSADLLSMLSGFAFPGSAPIEAPSRVHSDLSAFLADAMPALQNDRIYKTQKTHFNSILTMVAERINVNLPQFAEYAHHMIKNDKLSMRIFVRLLRSNTPFKLSLFMAKNPYHDEPASPPATKLHKSKSRRRQQIAKAEPPSFSIQAPFPMQCLATLMSLARSFAVSPVISPRQAYRKVRWIYLFLHSHGGPISPELIRALHHAGITRYKAVGMNPLPIQEKWIWEKVVEVEGEEVARQLQRWGDDGYAKGGVTALSAEQIVQRDPFARPVPIEKQEVRIRKFLIN